MRKVGFLLIGLLGLALITAACGGSGDSDGGSSSDGGSTSGGNSFTISGSEFAFDPDSITVSAGEEVSITFENTGTIAHDLSIESLGVATAQLVAGASETITFTASSAGTIDFICAVPGHAQSGMVGTITVN